MLVDSLHPHSACYLQAVLRVSLLNFTGELRRQYTKSFLLVAARQQRPPLLIAWPSVLSYANMIVHLCAHSVYKVSIIEESKLCLAGVCNVFLFEHQQFQYSYRYVISLLGKGCNIEQPDRAPAHTRSLAIALQSLF